MDKLEEEFAKEMLELRKKFAVEAVERIAELEAAALSLENMPDDSTQVESLFRGMHSLKGSGGMFDYNKISEFTHNLETIYDFVRKGKIRINSELLSITLDAIDHLKVLIEMGDELPPEVLQSHKIKTQRIKDFSDQHIAVFAENEPAATNINPHDGMPERPAATYFVSYKPNAQIFNQGNNPLYQIDDMHGMGDIFVIPHTESIPTLDKLETDLCYCCWEIVVASCENQGTLADVFIFVEDESQIVIQQISDDNLLEIDQFVEYLKALKAANELIDLKDLKQFIDKLPPARVNETFDNAKHKSALPESRPDLVEQPNPNIVKAQSPVTAISESTISSIRVSSEKIDTLMNLVSEMVTVQARLNTYAAQINDPDLLVISESVQKLSKQLRDNAFSISLIPISSISTRFQRLVRDLSLSLHKKVKFVIEGEDTEVDKNIIEHISDPLLHLIRNSLDHGIESPEIRRQSDKPEEGMIRLSAGYSGSNVKIQLYDDGAGINQAAVVEKAIQNKILKADEILSEEQIFNLIFTPGFSTSSQVSDVSGRGVGMDVVNKKISEIRGEVSVSSKKGKGTTITILLPLTLAIIDGLQVLIGRTSYVVPTSAVHKIYSVAHSQIQKSFDNLLVLDGKQTPFFYLRQQFNHPEDPPAKEEVIVVKYENKEVGLIIDKVMGEFQTVLKPLGRHYQKQEFISGATILGDGSVALVLDTNKIISGFAKENQKTEIVK
jgi:two-component system chemotaxis sensor kinase CheA